jgi:hypothetical protein
MKNAYWRASSGDGILKMPYCVAGNVGLLEQPIDSLLLDDGLWM